MLQAFPDPIIHSTMAPSGVTLNLSRSTYLKLKTMAVSYYLPSADKDRIVWGKNYNSKFPGYAALLGFTAAETTAVQNDIAMFIYSMDILEIFKTEMQERTQYKDTLRDGPIGKPLGAFPSMPALPVAPVAVPAGVFPRIMAIVKRAKAHSNYNEAIGKDLGIIGAEQSSVMDDLKPVLTVTKTGGNVIVKYKKGKADGLQLYSRRGTETEFTLLAVVTKTEYKDTRPNLVPSQAETRQYQAWYFKNDESIGQISDDVTFVV